MKEGDVIISRGYRFKVLKVFKDWVEAEPLFKTGHKVWEVSSWAIDGVE